MQVEIGVAGDRSIATAERRDLRAAAHGQSGARRSCVAVPSTACRRIAFEPPLPARVREAAGMNAGAALKVVMLARGVAPHGIAVGAGPA